LPYSYGKENLRQDSRLWAQQRKPRPSLPAPYRVERREPSSPSPALYRVVRRQKSRSGRINFQMVCGLCLIVFSLVVVLTRGLVSTHVAVLRSFPSSQIDQTNQGISIPLSFPVKKISSKVTAFSQRDKTQYNNETPEWSLWSRSACSGCAMAALMDAYSASLNGRPLNCGDVLEAEYRLSVYNPVHAWGLRRGEPDELAQTAAQFGFTGYYTQKLSLDDLITLANAGIPSIVRIPSHVLILNGGDQFLHGLPGSRLYAGQAWMAGWYIILTPNTNDT
jgi:hypothetical protein